MPATTPIARTISTLAHAGAFGLTLLMGCSSPKSTGFDDPSPAGRLAAIQAQANTDDPAQLPRLIACLSSDDPAERLLAIGVLRKKTGEDFGYDHAGTPRERSEAIARWAAWYKEHYPQRQLSTIE